MVLDVGLETITVRLLGINSPETDECFHDEATSQLITTIDGATVGIDVRGQDQFERTLAYLWDEDEMVNLEIVDRGLAIAKTPDEADPYGQVLLASEQTAFESAVGLWGRSVCGASGEIPAITLDPSGYDSPGADDMALADETIIVTNSGEVSADIGGFTLRDESSVHRLLFPDGTNLEPGESIRVSSDDLAWNPGGGPVWNNDGDMALLLDSHGRVVARSRYRP